MKKKNSTKCKKFNCLIFYPSIVQSTRTLHTHNTQTHNTHTTKVYPFYAVKSGYQHAKSYSNKVLRIFSKRFSDLNTLQTS